MPFTETAIPGLVVFEPKIFEDSRGYFYESYNKKTLEEANIHCNFVQDNISFSTRGVLRGLHYQLEPYAQSKLVRVLQGEVLDVAVDTRKGSPTYGESYSIILTAHKKNQLFIPHGFAHGFLVLSETAEFFYKCDNYYNKSHESGIIYNDPDLNIDWKFNSEDLIVSDKDTVLKTFAEAENNFTYTG